MSQGDSTVVAAQPGRLIEEPDFRGDPRSHIQQYWENHYQHDTSPVEPSPFAVEVAQQLAQSCAVVDLGCGNGRDSLYLASLGHRVIAVDGSAAAVSRLKERAEVEGAVGLTTLVADLSSHRAYADLAVRLPRNQGPRAKTVIYARFLLHAMPIASQDLLMASVVELLAPGDEVYLEYRTGDLDAVEYEFGRTHYRRSVDPDHVNEGALRAGMAEASSELSTDFAPYGRERPLCARTRLVR